MPIPNRNAPLSRTKLLAVALQGVCIGATFGYIFMAATQAVRLQNNSYTHVRMHPVAVEREPRSEGCGKGCT